MSTAPSVKASAMADTAAPDTAASNAEVHIESATKPALTPPSLNELLSEEAVKQAKKKRLNAYKKKKEGRLTEDTKLILCTMAIFALVVACALIPAFGYSYMVTLIIFGIIASIAGAAYKLYLTFESIYR